MSVRRIRGVLLICVLCAASLAAAQGVPATKAEAAAAPPAEPALAESAADRVAEYRAQAEELIRFQGEMGWSSWVEGAASDQASLYGRFGRLFQPDAIADTREVLAQTTDPEERRALRFLLAYQQVEYIGAQTSMLDDIYMDLEASLTVWIDGRPVPYRELHGVLADESDRKKRAAYAGEEYRVYDLLNRVVLSRQVRVAHDLARNLGYDSYTDLAAAYRMVDVPRLAEMSRRFLDESEDLYLALFDRLSPIPRAEFHRSDTLFLLGGHEFDAYFPADRLIPTMDEVLIGMGIDRRTQPNLTVDDRDLATKVPRAVCFSIDVPDDVRLSIKPVGGKEDYASLMHEMGHGQHFANTMTDVWEFQQLGSSAVTETFAYLFEFLVDDPRWAAKYTEMDGETIRRYVEHAAFVRLYMARRYMAKFLYEVDLHGDAPDPRERYRAIMSRAYGYELTDQEASRYLSDVDPFLYSADYVQAFFLEAQLRRRLIERFGEAWWANPNAGVYLRGLFARGNALAGEEFGRRLGFSDGLDPSVFVDLLQQMLEG